MNDLLALVRDLSKLLEGPVSIASHGEAARQTAECAAALCSAMASSPTARRELLDASIALLMCTASASELAGHTMHAVMPTVLLAEVSKGAAPTKWALEVRAQTLTAVVDAAKHAPSASLIWLQHLLAQAPDRSELRSLAVEAAVQVARSLSWANQCDVVSFVEDLARSAKAAQRTTALEVCVGLLGAGIAIDGPSKQEAAKASTAQKENKKKKAPKRQSRTAMAAAKKNPEEKSSRKATVEEDSDEGFFSDDDEEAPAAKEDKAMAMEEEEEEEEEAAAAIDTEGLRTGAVLGEILLELVLERTSDRAPGVRCKALSCLASTFPLAGACLPWSLLRSSFHLDAALEGRVHPATGGMQTPGTGGFGLGAGNYQMGLSLVLVRRIGDAKPLVRKEALKCLALLAREAQPPLRALFPTRQYLEAFGQRTLDSSPAVRKDALKALQGMLPGGSPSVASAWCEAVLPAVLDPESAVQDQAVSQVYASLFAPLERAGSLDREEEADFWGLTAALPPGLFSYLEEAAKAIHVKHGLSKGLIEAIQTTLGQTEPDATASPRLGGLWMLLEASAPLAAKHLSPRWCLEMWRRVASPAVAPFALRVLRVLSSLAPELPAADAAWLRSDLSMRCGSGPSAMPQPYCEAAREMIRLVASLQKPGELKWAEQMLNKLLEQVAASLSPQGAKGGVSWWGTQEDEEGSQEDGLSLALFEAGELVQLFGTTQAVPKQQLRLREKLAALTQMCVSGEQTREASTLSAGVRAQAFAALGKLCLCDATLARRCTPTLIRELQRSEEPVVRNNVLVVMCDLCRRHTSLVEAHVPALATRLVDPNVTVRRHTLALLSHLIHLDYLKLKGSTFYYLCLPLADDDQGIREMAQSCLAGLMKRKDSNGGSVASNHFVEACFFLNSCRAHPVYNQFDKQLGEDLARHLSEATHGERTMRRHAVYRTLLSTMQDEHKFIVAGKLAQDVLGQVVDGQLALKDAEDVVSDALWALGSKEIRLAANRSRDDEEDGGATEEPGTQNAAKAAVDAAKGKLIGKIARKNLVENVVPIMIALKAMMEKQRSPLVRHLMGCLKEVVAQYKSEAADLFAADPRLAAEIEYDMRRPLTPAPAKLNGMMTPSSLSAVKARRRGSMTPGSRAKCVTPASKRSGDAKVVLSSPAEAGAVRQWNVVPTPARLV